MARAVQAGVRGYALSTRVAEELPRAIRIVGGGLCLSPDLPAASPVRGGYHARARFLAPLRVLSAGPA